MAHKTLIGGTAYEIKGGKTLIDGTAYEIKGGKTLVGGTVYEVGFGGFEVIIDFGTITLKKLMPTTSAIANVALGTLPVGYDTCTHAIINGVVYELAINAGSNDTSLFYQLPDCDSVYQISISRSAASVMFSSTTEGTYTVQLGILS